MFERIRKYFALKAYARKLGPLLKKRYGGSKDYTPGQVRTTVEVGGLNPHYLYYGYAMFCQEKEFQQLANEASGDFDLQGLRQEIGDKFFSGDSNFSATDACSSTADMSYGSTDLGNDCGSFPNNDLGGGSL
jgi:hypothetical protein